MKETEVKALNGFTALSNEELETVDGGGITSAIAGAIIGGTASGCATAIRLAGESLFDNSRSAADTGHAILDSMIDGAMVAPVAAAITHWSGGDEQDTKAAALATFTACTAIGAVSPLP